MNRRIDHEKFKHGIFDPLMQWIEGNKQNVSKEMSVELLNITNDMVDRTISECFERCKKTLESKNDQTR